MQVTSIRAAAKPPTRIRLLVAMLPGRFTPQEEAVLAVVREELRLAEEGPITLEQPTSTMGDKLVMDHTV
jgi:hypothetical protein